jgi:chromate transporter
MREETVRRRKWLEDQEFLDLLGAASLIPGPSSTELGIYLGYKRAGWRGLIAAGVCFIAPAMAIVLALAWLYVRYGQAPAGQDLLYGIKPVVVAIVLQALWALGKTAVKGPAYALVGLGAAAAYLLANANPLLVLLAGAVVVMVARNPRQLGKAAWRVVSFAFLNKMLFRSSLLAVVLVALVHENAARLRTMALLVLPRALVAEVSPQPVRASLGALFLLFLKLGAIVFGSGYVLLVFLRGDLVANLHWLTDQQLLDAVAVGQFTPGPVFTTATFIGYVVAGVPGALLATLGIFLPAFIFVPLINLALDRVKSSPWARAGLDGVNVAALGLMAGVTLQLAQAGLVDALTAGIGLAAAAAVFWGKINPAWLVLGGGLIGLIWRLL